MASGVIRFAPESRVIVRKGILRISILDKDESVNARQINYEGI